MQTIEIVEEKNQKNIYKDSSDNGFELLSKYRTVIMGFAALWILYFHSYALIFKSIPILGEIEEFIRKIGFCGVDIFFFLSGIGLTFSIKKYSIKEFYYKRIKRMK